MSMKYCQPNHRIWFILFHQLYAGTFVVEFVLLVQMIEQHWVASSHFSSFFHCQIASNKTILFMLVLWVNIVILHSWRKRSIHPLTVKTCQNCAIVFFFAWYYQYNCKKLFPYLLHDLERIKTYLRTIDISQLYNLPTSRGVLLFKELIEQL